MAVACDFDSLVHLACLFVACAVVHSFRFVMGIVTSHAAKVSQFFDLPNFSGKYFASRCE